MKLLLILLVVGIWFLVGCQAVRDYNTAISDPELNQYVNTTGQEYALAANALLGLISFEGINHPVAILVGSVASLITGVLIGRKKRKQVK